MEERNFPRRGSRIQDTIENVIRNEINKKTMINKEKSFLTESRKQY